MPAPKVYYLSDIVIHIYSSFFLVVIDISLYTNTFKCTSSEPLATGLLVGGY